MDRELRLRLMQEGLDVDSALDRFMDNEEMYCRFLLKFFEDANYGRLQEAFSQKNAKECFEAAHALKGVILNLGMDRLAGEIKPIVEIFRSGTCEGADKGLEQFNESFRQLRDHLMTLLA
ncbi:MAG: Hpt domain-containing protein [Lachnospiraceae bacterium]|nr:Hpt domain-containing protein [Lachnospiraceae bacterium]